MAQALKANQDDLHKFLAMCTLFDDVKEKCVNATKLMITHCDVNERSDESDISVDISRLAEKRGQMIRFLESLQIRILDSANQDWAEDRSAAITHQGLDHFNRDVIRWSLEMENLESLLQSNLNKLKSDTRDALSDAFKRGKQHKGYNLKDIR